MIFSSALPAIEMIKTYKTSYLHLGLGKTFDLTVHKGHRGHASGIDEDGNCEIFTRNGSRHVWVPKEYFKIIKEDKNA